MQSITDAIAEENRGLLHTQLTLSARLEDLKNQDYGLNIQICFQRRV
jgi:hypothetical protein